MVFSVFFLLHRVGRVVTSRLETSLFATISSVVAVATVFCLTISYPFISSLYNPLPLSCPFLFSCPWSNMIARAYRIRSVSLSLSISLSLTPYVFSSSIYLSLPLR